MKRLLSYASLLIAGTLVVPPVVQACGYHDPRTIAFGALNLSFPKALYVRTAVWMAENAGLLPPRDPQAALNMFGFHSASADLRKLATRMSAGEMEREPVSIAVVLIDSMLWTRFVATAEGYVAEVHVEGPQAGDVVVVTDAKVIRAFVNRSMGAVAAETHGLIRLYGPAEFHDKARSALVKASAAEQAVKAGSP